MSGASDVSELLLERELWSNDVSEREVVKLGLAMCKSEEYRTWDFLPVFVVLTPE